MLWDSLPYLLGGAYPDGPIGGAALTVLLSLGSGILSALLGLGLGIALAMLQGPARVVLTSALAFLRAIPVLIAEGFEFTSTGWLSGPESTVTPQMYALMGEYVDGEAGNFAWPPCIIEECDG